MLEPASIDHPHASLMRRFCSLGDNCELGIAQRRLGAEPADLLRWAAIDVSALLRLLSDRGAALAESRRGVRPASRRQPDAGSDRRVL